MDVIAEVRRVRGRIRVTLDSGEALTLSQDTFGERPLEVGDQLDLEEFDQWLLPRQYRPALDRAVGLLALRAHAQEEIRRKLEADGYRPGVIEMVLYRLGKEGFLDDEAFAREWVEARSGRKIGPRRIAEELRRKGVGSSEIQDALEEVDEERFREEALALARKALGRVKAGEDRWKVRQRITGMLVRRGFGWDVAKRAVDEVLGEE